MDIGNRGIEHHGTKKCCLGVLIVLFLHVDGAQIDIDDAQVFVEVHRSFEQGKGFVEMVALPFDVPEISQSLGMSGIES